MIKCNSKRTIGGGIDLICEEQDNGTCPRGFEICCETCGYECDDCCEKVKKPSTKSSLYIVIGCWSGHIEEENIRLAESQEEAGKIKEEILEEFGWNKNNCTLKSYEEHSGNFVTIIEKPELTEMKVELEELKELVVEQSERWNTP